MNIYDLLMMPLEKHILKDIRQKSIPFSSGKVLEIGIGTGANIPFYNARSVKSMTGLDIKVSKEILKKADDRINLVESQAEKMPFADDSFDTVVATLVLCSVSNPGECINEIKRVLKNNGTYIFIEHILPSNNRLAAWFIKCNAPWSKLTKGCNLNRASDVLISGSFDVQSIEKTAGSVLCYGVAKNIK